jgi:hypothetical protein
MIKDNSYYKLKYLKYKSKYINYKNLIGGGPNPPTRLPPLNPQKQQIQSIYKKLYDNIDQEIVIPKILLTGTDKQKENAIKLYIIISKEFNQILSEFDKFLLDFESIFQSGFFGIGQIFDIDGTMTPFLKNKLKELFKKSYVSKLVIEELKKNSNLYTKYDELLNIIVNKICSNLRSLQIVSTDKCDDETRKEIVSNFFNSGDLFEKLVFKIVDEKIKDPDADENGRMVEAFISCIIKNEDIDLETKKNIVGLIFSILEPHHLKYDFMKKCNPNLRKATLSLFYPTECYKLKIAHKLFQKVSIFKDEITTNQKNVKKLLQKEQLEKQLQPLRIKLEIQLSEIEKLKEQLFEIEQLKNQKQLLESKIKELDQLKEQLKLLQQQLQPLEQKELQLKEQLFKIEQLKNQKQLLESKIKELDQLKEQLKLLQQQLQPLEQKELQLKEQEQKQLKELEILQKEKDPLEQKIKPLINILPSNTLALEIKRLKEQQEKDAKRRQQQQEEAEIKQQQEEAEIKQQEAEPRQQEKFILRQQEEEKELREKRRDDLLNLVSESLKEEEEEEDGYDD